MKYASVTACATDSRYKEAALYYEHVIPLSLEIYRDLVAESIPASQTGSLFAPTLRDVSGKEITFTSGRRGLDFLGGYFLEEFLESWLATEPRYRDIDEEFYTTTLYPNALSKAGFFHWSKDYSEFCDLFVKGELDKDMEYFLFEMKKYMNALRGMAVKSQPTDFFVSSQEAPTIEGGGTPSFALTNLELVDTSKLSWEQLFELRQDSDAMKKLRNLKLFMTTEYEGRENNIDFVRDDLARRIDEYRGVTESWSLDTERQTLSMLLSNVGLPALAANSLARLFNIPPVEVVGLAGLIGTATGIGSTMIYRNTRRREFKTYSARNPVSFLVEAQALAEKSD